MEISTRAVFAVIRAIKPSKLFPSHVLTRPYRVRQILARRCAKSRKTHTNFKSTETTYSYSFVLDSNYSYNYLNVEISTRNIIAVNELITPVKRTTFALAGKILNSMPLAHNKKCAVMIIGLDEANVREIKACTYIIYRVFRDRQDDAEGDKRANRGDTYMHMRIHRESQRKDRTV